MEWSFRNGRNLVRHSSCYLDYLSQTVLTFTFIQSWIEDSGPGLRQSAWAKMRMNTSLSWGIRQADGAVYANIHLAILDHAFWLEWATWLDAWRGCPKGMLKNRPRKKIGSRKCTKKGHLGKNAVLKMERWESGLVLFFCCLWKYFAAPPSPAAERSILYLFVFLPFLLLPFQTVCQPSPWDL